VNGYVGTVGTIGIEKLGNFGTAGTVGCSGFGGEVSAGAWPKGALRAIFPPSTLNIDSIRAVTGTGGMFSAAFLRWSAGRLERLVCSKKVLRLNS
jgi:hypothetical protein